MACGNLQPKRMAEANHSTVTAFYDGLAPLYDLIFNDWQASIDRQAKALDGLIRDRWGERTRTVLDVACGIGTQALGLAARGYQVTASDLSPAAVERARREAKARNLNIEFSVADMRRLRDVHVGSFDLIVACDNSIPHLLSDRDIAVALTEMHARVVPGGGCLFTVRDYDKESRDEQVRPYGIRVRDGRKYLLFQTWTFKTSDVYDVALYVVEDTGENECRTSVFRSSYYAVSVSKLMGLMEAAGFVDVQRHDDCFYQPVITGSRP